MPEALKFGKYINKKWSVEQLVLNDYPYFYWMINSDQKKPWLYRNKVRDRMYEVYFKVNNFKSVKNCSYEDCQNPAKYILIRHTDTFEMISSLDRIFCSPECYQKKKIEPDRMVMDFKPLRFDSALSEKKADTNRMIREVMEPCLGVEKRRTSEYLEDLFNNLKLWTPYNLPEPVKKPTNQLTFNYDEQLPLL